MISLGVNVSGRWHRQLDLEHGRDRRRALLAYPMGARICHQAAQRSVHLWCGRRDRTSIAVMSEAPPERFAAISQTWARSPFPPIADYAFLSDCEATCLIAPNGAVEWMCLPRPDSPS